MVSYRRGFTLPDYLPCYVRKSSINSLVCWLCMSALGLVLFQICSRADKLFSPKASNSSEYSHLCFTYFQEFLNCPSLYLSGAFLLPGISLLSKFILSRCISTSRNVFIVLVCTFLVHFYFQEFLHCLSLCLSGAFLLPGMSSLS